MDEDRESGTDSGKRVRAIARFAACYGRLPSEFPEELRLGLTLNIPAIEAAHALQVARGIAIAMGDSKSLGNAVFDATGDARLAHKVTVASEVAKHHNA